MFEIGFSHLVNMARSIRFACYNLHGFNNGSSGLYDPCQFADVITVEEHWLAPHDLSNLINFNNDYKCLGWSAMYDKLSSGILTGRPFGGVGILIRKCLGIIVNVVEIMSNYRVAATCLTFNNGYKLMVFIVYFPCQSNDFILSLIHI